MTYTLKDNLTHFTDYNIELYVCRETHKDENISLKSITRGISDCSLQKAMTTAKTSKKGKLNVFIDIFFKFQFKLKYIM